MVSISGYQFEINEEEPIEFVTSGNYYNRNGKHYILYEERLSDEDAVTKSTMKLDHGVVELTKRGASNVHMQFESGKTNMTYYDTPVGSLLVGIHTEDIQVMEEEHEMKVHIKYSLEINCTHVSACEIQMCVNSKTI